MAVRMSQRAEKERKTFMQQVLPKVDLGGGGNSNRRSVSPKVSLLTETITSKIGDLSHTVSKIKDGTPVTNKTRPPAHPPTHPPSHLSSIPHLTPSTLSIDHHRRKSITIPIATATAATTPETANRNSKEQPRPVSGLVTPKTTNRKSQEHPRRGARSHSRSL
jgi:hypothetical protein